MESVFKYKGYTFEDCDDESFYLSMKHLAMEIAGSEGEGTNDEFNVILDDIIDSVAAYIFQALEENAGKSVSEWNISFDYITTLMASIDFLDYEFDGYTVDYDIEDRYERRLHIFKNPKNDHLFAYDCDSWLYGYREMTVGDWYPVVEKTITKTIYVKNS